MARTMQGEIVILESEDNNIDIKIRINNERKCKNAEEKKKAGIPVRYLRWHGHFGEES